MGPKFVLLLLSIFSEISRSIQRDYTAAVLEHAPLVDSDPSKTIEDNLQEYRNYLRIAQRNQVDIIVFPEYGLTGILDDPTNHSVVIPDVGAEPGNFTDYVIKSLSDAAIEHKIYIVANILEKSINVKNKTEYFNTNIVFDRKGNLIAKYRKIHLYIQGKLTPGKISDLDKAVFSTDFDRTFGTFICFDIMFYNPSRKILSLSGTDPVTDIAFTTGWHSILPFYHSLSFHQAYAAENKVNFLSANINAPKDGQSGSGIFGADGTVYSYYLSGKTSTKLLISSVKTSSPTATNTIQTVSIFGLLPSNNASDIAKDELSKYNTSHYFKSSDYKFKLVDLFKGNITDRICDGPFCCDFTINVTASSANTSAAIYQLVAYRGLTMLGAGPYGPAIRSPTKMCFLIACESKNPSTCGTRNVNETAIFSRLSVRAKVRNELEQYYMPITLTTDLLPVYNTTYESSINTHVQREIQILNTETQSKVLLFGIFSNGVESLTFSWMLSVLVVFNLFKYFL